jgi:hypothetical protein
MKKRVAKISIGQTSKVIAIVYAILASPISLWGLVRLFSTASSSEVSPGWLIVSPFIYGACSYVLAVVTCLIYNLVARIVGGVEFSIGEQ